MTPERIILGEGVALNVIECNKFKTNCIAIRFLCPLTEDIASLNALLPFVLKRGCRRLPSMTEMEKEFDMLYGTEIRAAVGKTGDTQFFGFTAHPLCDSYAEGNKITDSVLSLMSELLYDPNLDENGNINSECIEVEKRVLADKVRETINNKAKYSLQRCSEEMGKNDPSSIPATGSIEQIDAITPEDLTKTLKTALEQYQIEIWCAGSFDKDELITSCRRLFVNDKRMTCGSTSLNRIADAESVLRITEEQPVKQGKLCVGFTTDVLPDDNDAPILNLFLEIFSNSPVSKLFSNVREKLSLCYYCSAVPNTAKGTIIVASGIENENANTAEKAILRELECCVNADITDDEMEAAKLALLTSSKSIYDDYGSLISWYFAQQLYRKKQYSPEEYASLAVNASKEDVARVASSLKLHTVYLLKGTAKEDVE